MKSAPELPSVVASRYVPIRLIAKGGMGAVYEVEHTRTGERLALKVLLSGVGAAPDALERFKREARASARIKSENVVRVIDADVAPELGGAPFLVMELLDGVDLERAAVNGPLPPQTVVDWLRQVARAVDKAHRLGIVHRDLKPENLFLAQAEGRAPIVKILDFGIMKMTGEGTGGTSTGQILGTPTYMAPEQASSNTPITSAADRFALGLIAYRLLLGEPYYKDRDVVRILAQLLHEQLEPPSKRSPRFGPAFDAWFLKACSRSPQERFGTAIEQVESLAEALGLARGPVDLANEPTLVGGARASDEQASGAGESDAPITVPGRGARRPAPARRIVVLAAIVSVAVVMTVGALVATRGERSGPSRAATAPSGRTAADAPAREPQPAPAPAPSASSSPAPVTSRGSLPAAAAVVDAETGVDAGGPAARPKAPVTKARRSGSRAAAAGKPTGAAAAPAPAAPAVDPYAEQK